MKLVDLSNPIALATIIANSNANSIPVSATGTAYASQAEGFPHITMIPEDNGGEAPHGLDFNGFLKMLSSHVFNIQNGSPETFNPAVSTLIGGYPKNAQLWLIDDNNSRLLKSTKDDNTDNFLTTPSVIGTSWVDAFPTKDYVDNNFVTLNTAQTITGSKTFTKTPIVANSIPAVHLNQTDVTKGTTPEAAQYSGISFRDSTGADTGAMARILTGYEVDKDSWISLRAFQCASTPADASGLVESGITVHYPASGSPYAVAPTPTEDTTNSTQIDTVGARNTKLSGYVTLAGAQTISGNKTFTGNMDKQNTAANKGENTARYWTISHYDKNGTASTNRLGMWQTSITANGNTEVALYAYKNTANTNTYDSIKIIYPASGLPYATCPTPTEDTTNSTQIDTVGARNTKLSGYVTLATDQTITGQKTIDGSLLTKIDATRNVTPATAKYSGIGVRDNDNNVFASYLSGMDTSGNASVLMRVFNPKNTSSTDVTNINLRYNADGSKYATCPAGDVANSILTTLSKSKASNGYFELGNGLIVQWGTSSGSGTRTVTFPKAFSSTNYTIVAISHGNSYCVVEFNNKAAGSAKIGNSTDFDWLAIGY